MVFRSACRVFVLEASYRSYGSTVNADSLLHKPLMLLSSSLHFCRTMPELEIAWNRGPSTLLFEKIAGAEHHLVRVADVDAVVLFVLGEGGFVEQ